MRWYIVRTLLHKEILRNLANRGGVALLLLPLVAAMLLALFSRGPRQAAGFFGGVQICYVDYWKDEPWIHHLMANQPPELQPYLRFRAPEQMRFDSHGNLVYPQNTGAIQIRVNPDAQAHPQYLIQFWHHGPDASTLAPFETWFWKESRRYFRERVTAAWAKASPGTAVPALADPDTDELWHWKESYRLFQNEVKKMDLPGNPISQLVPDLEAERQPLQSGLVDVRSSIAAALVIFALFFACIYTLPSLTCEEHERGTLLAQALSPASPLEILASKALFYPVVGIALGAVLAGIHTPAVLRQEFLWLTLVVTAVGFLGIGMTIASLARSQREASMGALCYLLAVALIVFLCQRNQVPLVPYLVLEFHCPRALQAALNQSVGREHWTHLAAAAILALGWFSLATYLFRRRGWQ